MDNQFFALGFCVGLFVVLISLGRFLGVRRIRALSNNKIRCKKCNIGFYKMIDMDSQGGLLEKCNNCGDTHWW